MQQHHNAAVRLRWRYVHIGHPHLFTVIDKRQQLDRVRVGEAFKVDAVGLAFGNVGGNGRHEG